jgi:hypothetical protein
MLSAQITEICSRNHMKTITILQICLSLSKVVNMETTVFYTQSTIPTKQLWGGETWMI